MEGNINPKQLLINVLTDAGYAEGKTLFLHNSMPEDMPYPDTFVTFKNEKSIDDLFRENEPYQTIWYFFVSVYSNDPELTNTELLRLRPLLKEKGFYPKGKGEDIASDEPTHTGRVLDVIYTEINEI